MARSAVATGASPLPPIRPTARLVQLAVAGLLAERGDPQEVRRRNVGACAATYSNDDYSRDAALTWFRSPTGMRHLQLAP